MTVTPIDPNKERRIAGGQAARDQAKRRKQELIDHPIDWDLQIARLKEILDAR